VHYQLGIVFHQPSPNNKKIPKMHKSLASSWKSLMFNPCHTWPSSLLFSLNLLSLYMYLYNHMSWKEEISCHTILPYFHVDKDVLLLCLIISFNFKKNNMGERIK
jgi:hypothetical protein